MSINTTDPAITSEGAGQKEEGLFGSKEARKVVLSSFLGSAIEYYDFILYGTASALIFAPLFFANLDPALGTIASLLTFAIGYVARPLGGIIFGHFGDKFGRKRMLMVSMTVMGLASFLIGLVPTVETWGAIMLLVLRCAQGVAIGGEWGGAALMSLEHSSKKSRGLAASFTNAGAPAGAFLGTAIFALFALLPEEQFMSWGWRVPFLLSLVLLLIGLYVRSRVTESPVFTAALEAAATKKAQESANKAPLLQVLRRPGTLLAVGLSGVGGFVVQSLFAVFMVNYAVSSGMDRSPTLWAFAISQLFAAFTVPLAASLSDRIGRKPVMIAGLIGLMVFAFPIFLLMGSGQYLLTQLGFLLALPILHALTFGPMAAFLAETFPTSSRYTGASLGFQISTLLGAGFTPAIAASIMAATGENINAVAWFLIGACAVSAIVLAFFTKESRSRDISQ